VASKVVNGLAVSSAKDLIFVTTDSKLLIYSNGGSGTTFTLSQTISNIGTATLLTASSDGSTIAVKTANATNNLVVLKKLNSAYTTFQS
jgi:hypothetical protein